MDILVVVTHQSWVAQDFRAANVLPTVQDYGLDNPLLPTDLSPSWWMVTEHAARLRRTRIDLELQSPGPFWLSEVPKELLGRHIWAGTVGEYLGGDGPASGWVKPAEFKHQDFVAHWEDTRDGITACLQAPALPVESFIQVCPEYLVFEQEHRVFVRNKHVVTSFPYADAASTSWDVTWSQRTDLDGRSAQAFTEEVVATVEVPDGVVIDVGRTASGSWVVVEANPVWSSSPYGADSAEVVRTVVASNAHNTQFTWVPDAWLVAQANRKALLRSAPPAWLPRMQAEFKR